MSPRRILVLAPHADDEVLGVGGAMARWAQAGHEVTVAIVTRGMPPGYSESEEQVCREETRSAHHRLGVDSTLHLDLPAAGLEQVPQPELNARLVALIRNCAPDELYLPFVGDIHLDHQRVFQSALVAARPNWSGYPRAIYAYETLSETNWNAPGLSPAFQPNHFVDISGFLAAKLEALACFRSQLADFPNERSLQAVQCLAQLRGACVHLPAAEAFVAIRVVA